MVKMRVPIVVQLFILVLLSALVGVGVISLATWITNHNFVLDIRSSRLSLTASLKAAQVSSNLLLMQSLVRSVSTRVLIQSSLQRYNNGNNTEKNWARPSEDLQVALDSGNQASLLLQGRIFPKNDTGLGGGEPLLSITGPSVIGYIPLPGRHHENGSQVYLGDTDGGYPEELYPNLEYSQRVYNSTFNESLASFSGTLLDESSILMLGPLQLNESFSLLSLTMPIINNTSAIDILGWLTIVLDMRLIHDVINADEGLDRSGVTLLVGPSNVTNQFAPGILFKSNQGIPPENERVRFVIAPDNRSSRHPTRFFGNNPTFDYKDFPAVKTGLTRRFNGTNNADSLISTKNEDGHSVAIGFAMPSTQLCDWIVLVEQSHAEVWGPINHLRDVLLACVFGTIGALFILTVPIAIYSSRPITRLRDATKKSVQPPGMTPDNMSIASSYDEQYDPESHERTFSEKIKGFAMDFGRRGRRQTRHEQEEADRRRQFRIPGKVKDQKHFITDELTELTQTYNEMTDELMMQYTKLDERVQQRTAELEQSKKAAEAANESKTMFIANISHELKTPVNGILGMSAVLMAEEDPIAIKRSLTFIFRSGDVLLTLLNDLLTFTRNQFGTKLKIQNTEFKLRETATHVLKVFGPQIKDTNANLTLRFEGPMDNNEFDLPGNLENIDNTIEDGKDGEKTLTNDYFTRNQFGPFGTGRVKDMILWGDPQRICQVLINLVGNALKFIPQENGTVNMIVRCVGDSEEKSHSRKGSLQSKQSKASNRYSHRDSRNRSRLGSDSESSIGENPPKLLATANEINALEKPATLVQAEERAPSPPPGRTLSFEFIVEDNGPGVPEDMQEKIFEPFVQGDVSLSRKHGGTGLGLSICQQLATLMNGSISLKSEPGKGSTFTMHLPLRHVSSRADSTASSVIAGKRDSTSADDATAAKLDADAKSNRSVNTGNSVPTAGAVAFDTDTRPRLVGLSQPFFAATVPMESPNSQMAAVERLTADASQREGKIRILVAEDNRTNQEVVLRMLKLEDILDVTIAKDGQEALDLVKISMENGTPYNIIFMDIQMPNLDGLQSTRLIREAGYSAPIVALTAYSEDSNVKECYESGMDYFLSKPIRRPALKQVLKQYCATIPEEAEGEQDPKDSKNAETTKMSSSVVSEGPKVTTDSTNTFVVGTNSNVPAKDSPAVSPMTK
ncbi:hypothetical protein M501DRAFT_784136 [Patellaria atrata CBS 101060]|uniref:histidine kinase n=1 Tax=Patellaria atrata CBS 101060 TaxID=1346257 RepID=A0A9P4SCM1_9PEZI|nr:hypothetical protein M501DRAFT_784136 [Patellaria atrata CBS 101060]